jgi:hypothetical protein
VSRTARAPAAAAVALGLALAAAGCTVGAGAGAVSGPLFVLGCSSNSNLGTAAAPSCYNMGPRFFAGEPIEDINTGALANRLLIRVERSGNRLEVNDTFYVDVQNAFEVARCLRGDLLPDGTPDWDTREVITVDGVCTGVPWCDWSARDGVAVTTCLGKPGPPGPGEGGNVGLPLQTLVTCPPQMLPMVATTPIRPLIHFGPEEFVRASFGPLFTCNAARASATATDGFIDFVNFGTATDAPPARDFKVNFGDRLQAIFHAVLSDDRVLTAIKAEAQPMPPVIGAVFDGYFDFDLERGRAAQPFP